MDPAPLRLGQLPPVGDRGPQHLAALGVVGDSLHSGTGVDQVGVGLGGDIASETVDDPDWVLEAVPSRDLDHQAVGRGRGGILEDLVTALDPARPAVLAGEHRFRGGAAVLNHATGVEDGGDGGGVEVEVLGREDVDRRRDQISLARL